MNKLDLFLKFIKDLMDKRYTGQLRLNFHEGNLSEKVEKKESVKLNIPEAKFITEYKKRLPECSVKKDSSPVDLT